MNATKDALYDEAMRAVPAIAKHRARGDMVSANATLKAYQRFAEEHNIPWGVAVVTYASAAQVWVQNLFTVYASAIDIPAEVAINSAIAAVLDRSDG